MHEVWARAARGKPSAVVGATVGDPTDGRVVVRVDCEGPWSTFGPLDEARRRIEQLLGEPAPAWDDAPERRRPGVLTRFLGDVEHPTIEASLVAAANRLASQTDGEAVLIFESLDRADGATLQGLGQILARDAWLVLPIVLQVGLRHGPAAELLDILEQRAGAEAILNRDELAAPAGPHPVAFDWRALPPDVLRVVRAASVVGRTFEAELVASLLDESPTSVLESMQRAADQGAPFIDRGHGRFVLPPDAPGALQDRLLPSLLAHYNLRLAELLSLPARASETGRIVIASANDEAPRSGEPSVTYGEVFADALAVVEVGGSPSTRPTQDVPAAPPARTAIRIDPMPSRPEAPAPHGVRPVPASPHTARRADDARAAKHFSAAGNPGAAVDRYVEAIRKVAARGDSRRALLLADEAHALLQQLPGSPSRAVLRARILAEAGRVQWRGAGLGPALTLPGALETLDAALAALRGDAPRDLRTDLASLIAGVCYDLGDTKSLQRALHELTVASDVHLKAGESELAARLLNDQAAVYLRAGDPVRATHLLDRSREIFDALHHTRPDDPLVIRERAETEHLLARLPLHARLREGREDDAYTLALGHARAAVEGYERLRSVRDIARVWESMGRLELRRGRLEPAGAHLLRALEVQRGSGDAVGLARTTAALSDLYLAQGRADEGITVLGDSVALNFEKGSPIGLAYNRRALQRQRTALQRAGELSTARAFATVFATLEQAEAALGKIQLATEAD